MGADLTLLAHQKTVLLAADLLRVLARTVQPRGLWRMECVTALMRQVPVTLPMLPQSAQVRCTARAA